MLNEQLIKNQKPINKINDICKIEIIKYIK